MMRFNFKDRPIEPYSRHEAPEQWADIAEWSDDKCERLFNELYKIATSGCFGGVCANSVVEAKNMRDLAVKAVMLFGKLDSKSDNLVEDAKQFATRHHAGQFRRDGVTPYITHPEAVASKFTDARYQAVAWLHDVLEDTNATAEQLAEAFPAEIVDAVVALTKEDGESYEQYLVGVSTNAIAIKVKIADIRHNLQCDPSPKQCNKYAYALAYLTAVLESDIASPIKPKQD